MRTQWPIAQLSEVCHFQNGYAFKNSDYVEEGHGAFEIFRMGNIRKGGGFNPDGKKALVHAKHAATLRRFLLNQGDILMCMTDMKANVALLGHTARMPVSGRYLVNQRVGRITVSKPEVLDQHFLYYYSNSPGYIDWLRSHANSGVQVNLSTEAILNSPIACPPLPIQRRIAGILSAYDELIENSQRRIKILEAMARALYREWFVHFRFPGHESVPRVPSPLGDIPQGWEVRCIGDCFRTVLGGTPSRAKPEFWEDGTISWINSGKVNDLRITEPSELITPLALERSAAKLMPKGTTVLAITGATLGQVSFLEIETSANQSVVGIVDPTGDFSEWVYLTISDRIKDIINHASGGAQQHINKEIVNDVQISLPPHSLAGHFKGLVAPMFRELATLLFQIQNLRRTRELLLPRLLSGQIDVEAMAS